MSGMGRTGFRTLRTGGFTLIELLVVIGIIGILVGLTAGGLAQARRSAQNAICLNNQRQLAQAWHQYVNEHNRFPNTGSTLPTQNPPYSTAWGGPVAHVRPQDAPNIWQANNRPINPYVQVTNPHYLNEIFRCPSDNGAKYAGSGLSVSQGFPASWFRFPEWMHTVYGVRGNSYSSNDWVWANIGSIDGAGPPFSNTRKWNHFHRPDVALVNPSLTVMIGDFGGLEPGILTEQQAVQTALPVAWWHGDLQCNIAFWDGSAKQVTMRPGLGYRPDYWLWLMPDRHDPTGTPIARLPNVRNPDAAAE